MRRRKIYSYGYRGKQRSLDTWLTLVFLTIGVGLDIFIVFNKRLPFGLWLSFGVIGTALLYLSLISLNNKRFDGILGKIIFIAKLVFEIFALAMIIAFIVIEIQISAGAKTTAEPNAEYVIILGAGLDGEKPLPPLVSRMDKALEYLRANPNAKVIATGGQGAGEGITEAEAARRYLVANGIEEARIFLEDKSVDTLENIQFASSLFEKDTRVVIVTNEFHIYRSMYIARKNGLNAASLVAPSPSFMHKVSYFLREFFSVVLMYFGKF